MYLCLLVFYSLSWKRVFSKTIRRNLRRIFVSYCNISSYILLITFSQWGELSITSFDENQLFFRFLQLLFTKHICSLLTCQIFHIRATGVVGRRVPCHGSTSMELKKSTLFQRKLNEIPQNVTLAPKFCLTFQIQYFEVSFFVVFKWQFFKELLFKLLNSSRGWSGRNHLLLTHVGRSSKKKMLLQSKLNELRQYVSLISKYCLTFQIQYFQVSIFVLFKCQFF